MTEVSALFMNPVIPWYQTAGGLEGYIWIEQNGQVVGGSADVPSDIVPGQTGVTGTDITTWITAALQDIMGVIVPEPTYSYPSALPMTDQWGIQSIAVGNPFKSIPFVAVAYTNDFQFGTLNIPTYEEGGARKIKFKIFGFGDVSTISPAYNEIFNYIDIESTNPILLTLELNPE